MDESDLGRMMRQHLWQQPAPLPAGQCHSFRSIATAELKPAQKECLLKVGDAKWSVEGLVDADETKRAQCGRKGTNPTPTPTPSPDRNPNRNPDPNPNQVRPQVDGHGRDALPARGARPALHR